MGAFRDMLTSDGKNSNKLSSKRVITFIAFICIVIAFFGNIFIGLVVESTVLNGMISIVFAGLGVTVGEHLLRNKNGENPNGLDDSRKYDNYGHNVHGDYNSHNKRESLSPDINVRTHTELGDN